METSARCRASRSVKQSMFAHVIFCYKHSVTELSLWIAHRQQRTLVQRCPNIGSVVPTLGQRCLNPHCCLGRGMAVTDDYIFVLFQHLFLSSNNIDFIDRFAFKGLESLTTLDISNNRLTTAPSLLEVKSTLQTLNLKWNYIKYIEDSYFDSCRDIATINIGFNELNQFPSIQNIAKTIFNFRVSSNNISDANFIYGNSFPKLASLSFGSNQIGSFCPPPTKFVPRLRTMNLQSNKLSRIQFQNESLQRELHVLLANNPWHCNGSLGWTQQCEIKPGWSMIVCMELLFLKDMVCESPSEARGLTPKEAGNIIDKYW